MHDKSYRDLLFTIVETKVLTLHLYVRIIVDSWQSYRISWKYLWKMLNVWNIVLTNMNFRASFRDEKVEEKIDDYYVCCWSLAHRNMESGGKRSRSTNWMKISKIIADGKLQRFSDDYELHRLTENFQEYSGICVLQIHNMQGLWENG